MPGRFSFSSSAGRTSGESSRPESLRPLGASRPKDPIDLNKLLAVYDDYPTVVHSLDVTNQRLEQAEDDARVAEEKQQRAEDELKAEKDAREKDRQAAAKDAESAAKAAKLDKDAAVKAQEQKVRDELRPKIEDLEKKLKAMTTERNDLKKELSDRKGRLDGWIVKMERMNKEREDAHSKEKLAYDQRLAAAEKMRGLDKEILDALRLETKKPEEVEGQ